MNLKILTNPAPALRGHNISYKAKGLLLNLINLTDEQLSEHIGKLINLANVSDMLTLQELVDCGVVGIVGDEAVASVKTGASEVVGLEAITGYFTHLWGCYPRREGKQQAIKTFEKKLRGLTVSQAKDKANAIYKHLTQFYKVWEERETELQYIPMFSSWLNAEIEDSPKLKGGGKGVRRTN